MNIFYLNSNPIICAREHCDKHVIKMIVEYAQLLSTAHRVLDGIFSIEKNANGSLIPNYRLQNDVDSILYKASHIKHPCAIWTRFSFSHYDWLFQLFEQCCLEYTRRYGKTHKTEGLKQYLITKPKNIHNNDWTEPPLAMPEQYKIIGNTIQSYRNYYVAEKAAFATWRAPARMPGWF